jgi:hypothetical protein
MGRPRMARPSSAYGAARRVRSVLSLLMLLSGVACDRSHASAQARVTSDDGSTYTLDLGRVTPSSHTTTHITIPLPTSGTAIRGTATSCGCLRLDQAHIADGNATLTITYDAPAIAVRDEQQLELRWDRSDQTSRVRVLATVPMRPRLSPPDAQLVAGAFSKALMVFAESSTADGVPTVTCVDARGWSVEVGAPAQTEDRWRIPINVAEPTDEPRAPRVDLLRFRVEQPIGERYELTLRIAVTAASCYEVSPRRILVRLEEAGAGLTTVRLNIRRNRAAAAWPSTPIVTTEDVTTSWRAGADSGVLELRFNARKLAAGRVDLQISPSGEGSVGIPVIFTRSSWLEELRSAH